MVFNVSKDGQTNYSMRRCDSTFEQRSFRLKAVVPMATASDTLSATFPPSNRRRVLATRPVDAAAAGVFNFGNALALYSLPLTVESAKSVRHRGTSDEF